MNDLCQRLRWTVLVLSTAFIMAGCDQQQPHESEQVSRPVKLYTLGGDAPQILYKYPGSVTAVNKSTLAFEVPGKVTDIKVKEGDLVVAGQVLAQLDPRDYQAQFESAKIEKDASHKDYERYKKALESNAVTPQAFDQAKRNMEVAQAAFKQAKKALEDTSLQAPFSGRIARKDIEKFDTVYAKQPVIQLHSDSALEMVVDVPEVDWVQGGRVASAKDINLSEQLFVTVSALPNERFPGVISEFSSVADPITRTYKVTVEFNVPQNISLGSGMSGHVLYQPKSTENANIYVPIEAIVGNSDNKAFVWLYDADKGVVTKQTIELGNITAKKVLVKSGLKKGDRIAVSGVHSLFDGYSVYPLED
ncbi:efflux RND transporter periplasmic adaptor subunit [Vibrio sp. Y2-5]|uniref:efflux RND transporter periplasmic adaptor subunit n=1 Tax=Vibrio sp. Y2-5 TaxID=2743977 RepID=UPI00166107C7|nr:efflux RND transporter periplasmic adaptor subunit [Vibrio sp. Y2-5]MBD0786119.1 efflux RND transporter periplasmic adaptor subunit [Vibrio sp. Y2-5]